MAVLLCLGLVMPAGPTGVKSEMGADILGLRSRMVAVVVAILLEDCCPNLRAEKMTMATLRSWHVGGWI